MAQRILDTWLAVWLTLRGHMDHGPCMDHLLLAAALDASIMAWQALPTVPWLADPLRLARAAGGGAAAGANKQARAAQILLPSLREGPGLCHAVLHSQTCMPQLHQLPALMY